MLAPQLTAALAKGATIEDFSHLTLSISPGGGIVRAIFELAHNSYITERYGDTHPLWYGSPPMGGDRPHPEGSLGRALEMACADLLEQVALLEADQSRPPWPHHVALPQLSDPPRPALERALAELAICEQPMFITIEQRTDGSAIAWANVLRGAVRSIVRDATDKSIIGRAAAGNPLAQQEAALRELAAALSTTRSVSAF